MNAQTILDRAIQSAADANVSLDLPLCHVASTEDGFLLIASVNTFPRSEVERGLMKSALCIVLLHEFGDDPRMRWKVFVPPVVDEPPPVVWCCRGIEEYARGANDFAQELARHLAAMSCKLMIDSYPWKDRNGMRQRAMDLVNRTEPHATANLDVILPPPPRHLPLQHLWADARMLLGRDAGSLLELYELGYRMARVAKSPEWTALADELFVRSQCTP